MEFDFSALQEQGISIEDGIGYTGGKDKYLSALQRFFKGFEGNKAALTGFIAASDLQGYCIKVHSLKGNARMIGANDLSDMFFELEEASRNGDAALVGEKTPAAIAKYAEIIEIIRPIGEMAGIKPSDEIDATEAKAVAEELLQALDDFDDDKSSELAKKLMGYPFRLTQKEQLKEAINYITDFMYDEAAELVNKIIPAIE